MSGGVVSVILAAALLHVLWNTLVKRSSDGFLATILIAVGAGLISGLALLFLPAMDGAAWLNVAGSVVAQSVYFPMVAATYRAGDMSQGYPVMRGSAPLLVALVSGPILGEELTGQEWLGVALICAGIFAIGSAGFRRQKPAFANHATGRDGTGRTGTGRTGTERTGTGRTGTGRTGTGRNAGRQRRPVKATLLALTTAVIIATYTVIDGAGVRLSGQPPTYAAWIFLFTAVPMLTWGLTRRRVDLLRLARTNYWTGLVGGFGNVGSYGLVLWAMTKAPVAAVAALRETSILFSTGIAYFVLRERVDRYRVGGTVIIAAGAIMLRLA